MTVIANVDPAVFDLVLEGTQGFIAFHGTSASHGPTTVGAWYSLPHLRGCAAVLGAKGFRVIEIRFPSAQAALEDAAGLAGLDLTHCSATSDTPEFRTLRAGLDAYASGASKLFPQVKLDYSLGTGFQQKVWEELRRIPYGQTRSYGEVAEAIGHPGAARAVGSACGSNPLHPLVPCHRVLGAGNRLGGFSGEMDWKRFLLNLEGATFRDS